MMASTRRTPSPTARSSSSKRRWRGDARPWDQLSAERRTQWARRMEVYAAQTEHLDRAIGRLLDAIRRLGVERDTLVLFLSDNGGAAEDPNRGDPSAPIGSRDSYR